MCLHACVCVSLSHLLPPQSTLEDYQAMPIEAFGEAVLRGMGWKKGEPIGKSNKGYDHYRDS